ncbi:MAG: prolipoprotein diacylglyceryl transferase [Candidatus Moranbacteria bacterium]|nr:prolipoprotein diacylglyceryl transferase [Candidatus Moranbacteria bacterium]
MHIQNFLTIWQNLPGKIDPELFQVGSFSIRWYSIGYLLAFATTLGLVWWRINRKEFDTQKLPAKQIKEITLDVFSILIFGMMIGARLGYFIFYDWTTILNAPGKIFIPGVNGFFGFSFHGGLIGALLGVWFYCRYNKLSLKALGNLIIPAIPLGLFWGRLGNFFNGELFGHETTQPWGMHFLPDQTTLQHPSQLYEALGEGVIIFVVLWTLRNKKWAQGNLISLFLILYGLIRFVIEFFRASPPEHIILNFLTTGQVLCLAMIISGIYLFKNSKSKTSSSKYINHNFQNSSL